MDITMNSNVAFINKSHAHIFRNFVCGLHELGHKVTVCGLTDIQHAIKSNPDHQLILDLYSDEQVYSDYNIWKGLLREFQKAKGGHKVDAIVHNDGRYVLDKTMVKEFNKTPYTHLIRSGLDASETIANQLNKPVYSFFDSPIDTSVFDVKSVEKIDLNLPNKFVFMIVAQGTYPPSFVMRGIDIAINAYKETFREDGDTALIVKTSGIQEDVVKLINRRKDIRYISKDLPQKQLARYLKTVDCMLSPIRGALWEAPVMEAAAMQTPCIATDAGGPAMFVVPGATGLLVKYEWAYYAKGARKNELICKYDKVSHLEDKWKEIDVDMFKHAMRSMDQDRSRSKKWGQNASDHVTALFNRKAMAGEFAEFLYGSKEFVYEPQNS